METVVKYRFDQKMVPFVKQLDIKTALFGYDKTDVYNKFKDLLVRAREVSQELLAEEYRTIEQMKAELFAAAGDPVKLEAFHAKWSPQDPIPDIEHKSDEEQTDGEDRLIESDDSASEEDAELDPPAAMSATAAVSGEYIAEPGSQLEELQTELDYYREREEELNRTEDILREARLEGEAIVHSAQVRAEQELFLYRAKRRDEEKAFQEAIKGLEAQKEQLEETCMIYRNYIAEGCDLFDQMREYTMRFTPPVSSDSD
ncbi:MAG: hypothetical protein WBL60_01850 [Saccharofermentanales bacterium]|jgi:prefoldin subunit 5